MHDISAHTVQPEGLAAAIFYVTIVFSAICPVIIALRVWVRLKTHNFGDDDYLMCTALVTNLVHNGVVMRGTYVGIGTLDSKLDSSTIMEGKKYIYLWQMFYAVNLVFVKSSILATIKRLTTRRLYLNTIWGLIILSALMSTAGVLVLLVSCRPIEASWNPSLGTCIAPVYFVILSKLASVVNVLSDFAVAVLPMLLLRGVQMKLRVKIMTSVLLGLGILASIASIIRIPYTDAYRNEKNLVHNIGNIILWTVVECDIGIIAGSLPMVRQFVKYFRKEEKSSGGAGGDDTELVTIGRVRGRHALAYESEIRRTVSGRDDEGHSISHTEGGVEESKRGIIKITRAVEQTWAKGYQQV